MIITCFASSFDFDALVTFSLNYSNIVGASSASLP